MSVSRWLLNRSRSALGPTPVKKQRCGSLQIPVIIVQARRSRRGCRRVPIRQIGSTLRKRGRIVFSERRTNRSGRPGTVARAHRDSLTPAVGHGRRDCSPRRVLLAALDAPRPPGGQNKEHPSEEGDDRRAHSIWGRDTRHMMTCSDVPRISRYLSSGSWVPVPPPLFTHPWHRTSRSQSPETGRLLRSAPLRRDAAKSK